jgi:hypothetical protein
MDADQSKQSQPDPDDDLSDVWLEDRKAYPGETFYGGRGVIFPSRMHSSGSGPSSADKTALDQIEYKGRMMKAFHGQLRKEVEEQFNSRPRTR